MSKYIETNEKFINPYNFVSISDCDPIKRKKVVYGIHSGSITCRLEILTPLFIPNTTKSDAFDNDKENAFAKAEGKPANSYDFFSYEDLAKRDDYYANPAKPIIPGSSIRGAMRAAFEAVVNGCLSTTDDETVLYRRTTEPKKKCGVIQKNGSKWYLIEAKKDKCRPMDKPMGTKVRNGYYLKGERGPGKKHDAVMTPIDGVKPKLLEKEDIDRLYNVWRLYQPVKSKIKGVNQTENHRGYRGWFELENIPVYYEEVNGILYISPACITKDVFKNTIKSLLKSQGEHQSCTDNNNLCASCRLFGMVSEGGSLASRLMFKDAEPNEDNTHWSDWYDSVRTLPILASPKVSAAEFYMEKEDGYYNYDFQVINKKKILLEKPRLRGRKFYWHRESEEKVPPDKSIADLKQRTRIRPLKASGINTFTFQIAYDRLSDKELQTLLWALTFGENANTHAHKLGYGKPYGYGSVRITVDEVTSISLDENLCLEEKVLDIKPITPSDSAAFKEYLAMTDFSKASNKVKYPHGDDGKKSAAYVWFGINKEIKKGAFGGGGFNRTLPKPTEKDVSLPNYRLRK